MEPKGKHTTQKHVDHSETHVTHPKERETNKGQEQETKHYPRLGLLGCRSLLGCRLLRVGCRLGHSARLGRGEDLGLFNHRRGLMNSRSVRYILSEQSIVQGFHHVQKLVSCAAWPCSPWASQRPSSWGRQ